MIEQVFGFFFGVLELGGQDLKVVALLHCRHLLVDDLLVHPGKALLHVGNGLRLIHGLDVQRDVERQGQVDDVSQGAVGQLTTETTESQHLAIHAVRIEAVGASLRLKVKHTRSDKILGAQTASA